MYLKLCQVLKIKERKTSWTSRHSQSCEETDEPTHHHSAVWSFLCLRCHLQDTGEVWSYLPWRGREGSQTK